MLSCRRKELIKKGQQRLQVDKDQRAATTVKQQCRNDGWQELQLVIRSGLPRTKTTPNRQWTHSKWQLQWWWKKWTNINSQNKPSKGKEGGNQMTFNRTKIQQHWIRNRATKAEDKQLVEEEEPKQSNMCSWWLVVSVKRSSCTCTSQTAARTDQTGYKQPIQNLN